MPICLETNSVTTGFWFLMLCSKVCGICKIMMLLTVDLTADVVGFEKMAVKQLEAFMTFQTWASIASSL